MNKYYLIIIISVFWFSTSDAVIYKYIDEKGVVRYTNQKPPDSAIIIDSREEIPLKPADKYQRPSSTIRSTESFFNNNSSIPRGYIEQPKIVPGETPCTPKLIRKSRSIYVVNCYEFNVDVQQVGDKIRVTGRVQYGDYCNLLYVKFYLKSESGYSIILTTEVPDVGGATASRLVEDSVRLRHRRIIDSDEKWKITDIVVSCD